MTYPFEPAHAAVDADYAVGEIEELAKPEQIEIDGCKIGYDNSGVGHNWQPATEDNCPTNIQEEIAGEIIDGGQSECDDFVASNGQHYRWS